jgi:diadenosine tetraphosphate (Ap4A) HIT family hydrolase
MEGVIENVSTLTPSEFSTTPNTDLNCDSKKCYTCKPRGTIKEHVISSTEHFTFNHDLFRRPLIIITSKTHYHTLYEMPDNIKLTLFNDINLFAQFWNLNENYQLMLNNGSSQTHHHFHIKMKINTEIANRMRRDHFTRINLQKNYLN